VVPLVVIIKAQSHYEAGLFCAYTQAKAPQDYFHAGLCRLWSAVALF